MTDRFSSHASSLTAPAAGGFALTPSDTVDLRETTRGLYVGTGGDLSVVMLSGDVVSLVAVPAGAVLPLRVTRLRATGTTAGNIVGLV